MKILEKIKKFIINVDKNDLFDFIVDTCSFALTGVYYIFYVNNNGSVYVDSYYLTFMIIVLFFLAFNNLCNLVDKYLKKDIK